MSDVSEMSAALDPSARRAFWRMLGHAALLGVIGVVAGLVFLRITDLGADWYGEPDLGWFEGPIWWVGVAASAGLVVALLRRVFAMPGETPGLIEDLKSEHVDVRRVPSIVAVSAVSLIGGASLGPEVALGQMGGGAAGWIARRRNLDRDAAKTLTLTGMAGAFGGLFSSPVVAMLLGLEIARPPRPRTRRVFYGSLVSSSVAFGLYFAVAGSIFLDIYEVPTYEFEDWHLLAGIALGVLAAVVAAVTVVIASTLVKLFDRLPGPAIVRPVAGAAVFGLVGVAVPLTNFTGSEQLATVLHNGSVLGLGLLVAILVGKMIAFGASSAGGFIGGPIFPILFIGGTAGIALNQAIPEVPLGLAFTCMLAAVPGSIVPAPFTMVLLVALLTEIGALQTAPILIAVGSAYLTLAAVQATRARRNDPGTEMSGPH